ncbi:MAG: ATP synthase F1 subunit delta [Armatimonadota bacterium]|nr:ATP synthase F1 subunit delta [Armatimonadota bacterium]
MARTASTTVARRYAEALFVAARDAGQIDATDLDLAYLEGLLQEVPGLLSMMCNPLLPIEEKNEILERIFGSAVQGLVLRFLQLLVEKRRAEVLPQIRALFLEMANEHRGILPAFVTSAVPLTPAEVETLTARLESMTGKRIALHTEVRPELIGGVRVRVGDRIIDGSVVGYLRQLRDQLRKTLIYREAGPASGPAPADNR